MGIIDKLCWKLVEKFPERVRVIHTEGDPYLLRFYITKNTYKEGIESPNAWGLYLHYFYRGDSDRELHNHPWKWALSFILSGFYVEERHHCRNDYDVLGSLVIKERTRKSGRFNYISHDIFHRVTIPNRMTDPVWTLFLAGPTISRWGFKTPETGVYMDSDDYFKLRDKGEENV